jgi:hypothetical protein
VVLFSTRQRAPGVTELELNLPKPVGSDLVSQFGQYVDTLNAARSAVTSVGNGITTGIFAARAPKGALQPGRPATSEGTSVVMATEGNKFEEVKARAQEDPAASPATAVGTPVVKAAENKLGEAVNGPETKPAAVKHMDEAIHTTAVKSMQPERENGAVKLAHRMLRTGLTSRNAQPAAERVPRWTGKTAIKDIDSYFDTVPTRNVNSFHEAAKKALHFGSAFGSEQSRDDLDGYFNSLAQGVHRKEFPADKAVQDLTDYYAKLPTKDVAPDHDPAHTKPAMKHLSALKAEKDLGDYFDQIPVKKVNPFHEAVHGSHHSSLPAYSSNDATDELDNYFDDLPVQHVNVFHESDEKLSDEQRASAQLRVRAKPARPTLATGTARKKEEKQVQAAHAHVLEKQAASYKPGASVLGTDGDGAGDVAATQVKAEDVAVEGKEVSADASKDEGEVSMTKAASPSLEKEADADDSIEGMADSDDAEDAGGDLLPWSEVDNRHVYAKGAGASKKSGHNRFRTVKDDTTFGRTRYQQVPGADGRAAARLARDEVEGERHLREKTRNWAALSDDSGFDADAPRLSEAVRHAGGYDTQYGLTNRLGSKVMEVTPEGDVVSNLVSRKFAKAFPDEGGEEDADTQVAHTEAGKGAADSQNQRLSSAEKQSQSVLPAPIGSPHGVVRSKSGDNPRAQGLVRARKWAPTPYWRIIDQGGPQQWKMGQKVIAEARDMDELPPAEKAEVLGRLKTAAWWRREHAKRMVQVQEHAKGREQVEVHSGVRPQVAAPNEERHGADPDVRSAGVRGPKVPTEAQSVRASPGSIEDVADADDLDQDSNAKAIGLGNLGMQALSQVGGTEVRGVRGRRKESMKKKLERAGAMVRHRGMAETLGAIIGKKLETGAGALARQEQEHMGMGGSGGAKKAPKNQQLAASVGPKRHVGMAGTLGEIIGVSACSLLGIAC